MHEKLAKRFLDYMLALSTPISARVLPSPPSQNSKDIYGQSWLEAAKTTSAIPPAQSQFQPIFRSLKA
ncbi:hypothetical protein PM082_023446 [Marasmius tenuissimus]|nr:hypothetical protein PM082_023446 [Marasmius tenuissimus]